VGWLSRLRSRPAASEPRKPAPPPGEPATVRLHSLALGNLLDSLVPGGSYRFLDLGSAVGSNIEYLSRFALSVQVADLWPCVASGEPRSWEKALEALKPDTEGAGFHAVLAWDLLNYLPPARLQELGARLAAVTRTEGRVFALAYYSREMPAEPLRFRIADRETLTYHEPHALRPAPRYPQRALQQAFSGFETEKGYVLKTGLQEFLFARRPPPPPAPPAPEEELPEPQDGSQEPREGRPEAQARPSEGDVTAPDPGTAES
jgi:hypothetical protein